MGSMYLSFSLVPIRSYFGWDGARLSRNNHKYNGYFPTKMDHIFRHIGGVSEPNQPTGYLYCPIYKFGLKNKKYKIFKQHIQNFRIGNLH